MPYIDPERRKDLYDNSRIPDNAGELNYLITILVNNYIQRVGKSYKNLNNAIGALECAKLELYRRIAAPYEDDKSRVNGDVYTI